MSEGQWSLTFITREDFKRHVRSTIQHYGDKLQPYDLGRFNSNIIDPIKMIFDRAIYADDWETIISKEIFRQRDKSNTNEIGYFHQRLFEYIDGCHVPPNGTEGGWDVIVRRPDGFLLEGGNHVHTLYIEMKNKHNTMNSSAAAKTYIKMQQALLSDDDCACFLVEAIAKRSQNVVWQTTVDKQKVRHNRIRRVSIDQFYSLVTGIDDAFYQVCMALPAMVTEVLEESSADVGVPEDSVYAELMAYASQITHLSRESSVVLATYMLGFSTYLGFADMLDAADERRGPL